MNEPMSKAILDWVVIAKSKKAKSTMQPRKKKEKNYIYKRSLFMSGRRFILDLLLAKIAKTFPRFFSFFLVLLFCPRFNLLSSVLKPFKSNIGGIGADNSKITVIYEQLHSRQSAYHSFFGIKLDRSVLCHNSKTAQLDDNSINEVIKKDWLQIWLYLLRNFDEKRFFIIFTMSDISSMPLKWHPMKDMIFFDAYDPLFYYTKNESIRRMCIENYKNPHVNYIIRDPRFTDQLRLARNFLIQKLYIPDASHLKDVPFKQMAYNSPDDNVIRFVSAGWVTSHGDEGILRSIKLIRKIWINSEIHVCFTKFMSIEDPKLRSLIEYLDSNPNCYIHRNLSTEQYVEILDNCDVGLSLHDVNVFGENYEILSRPFLSRCPSARVLDYAVRGLILMTTPEHRFQKRIFSKCSPHKMVLYLNQNSTKEPLIYLVKKKANASYKSVI